MKIEITHKGEDYMKIEVNGTEYEVGIDVSVAIESMLHSMAKLIKTY